ncbi:MAG TPA: dephospho-CoA kinase [Caldilineae bacterium]|nr:dephospho-CoA kinase [Caldilineae bacterium]
MSHPRTVIGLTGNIGTGKSTVLEILRQLGARTIDADQIAHQVIEPGGRAYDDVVATFGGEILAEDGSIDRAKLGQIVFNDPDRLQVLERIVHPVVFEQINSELTAATEAVIVIEAIKLLEAGMAITLCDQVWVVTTDEEQQVQRLMETRNMNREEAEARMRSQSPQAFKISQADVVLDNNGSLGELAAQVKKAWDDLELQPKLV